jgi:GntR family transcriptional regulator
MKDNAAVKTLPIVELDQVAAMHASPYRLYHSLGQIIRSKIQSGEWLVGKQIPSERMLMQAFSVSRATVRQAVENLVKEGILYREYGRGTFVSPPKIQHGFLRLLDFAMIMRRNGLAPGARLLGKAVFVPPSDIRSRLALPENAQTIYVQRLLLANAMPMIIESSHLPAGLFPNLMEAYDGKEDILSFIHQRYGSKVGKVSEVFEPVILESHEANLLGVRQGFPALWVDYTVLDTGDKPLACITALLRGDRCRFYGELNFE